MTLGGVLRNGFLGLLAGALLAGCAAGGAGTAASFPASSAHAPESAGAARSAPLSVFTQSGYHRKKATYTLTDKGETANFPADGDVTASATLPGIDTDTTAPLDLVESAKRIPGAAPKKRCKGQPFWYVTLEITGNSSSPVAFSSSDIPIAFSSPTLILSGYTYGLCVAALGDIIQDDFTTSPGGTKPVAPNGNSVSLTLVIPDYLEGSFPNNSIISVFFERKAS